MTITNITDIPQDILLLIINNDLLTFTSITGANLINKEFHDIIINNFDAIFKEKFKKHEQFLNLLDKKKLSLINSDVNIEILLKILNNLLYVSNMKKGSRYQHLLIDTYNGKLFNLRLKLNKEDQENIESETIGILMVLLDYVKENLDITKTNLAPWALHCLLEYFAIILSDDNRKKTSYLLEDYMCDILKNRIYTISRELKKMKDSHREIKYRLGKVLNYLAEIYDYDNV